MSVSGKPDNSPSTVNLYSKTPILGQKLYVVVVVTVMIVVIILVLIFLCLRSNRNSNRRKMSVKMKHSTGFFPLVCKDVIEIKDSDQIRIPKINVLGKEEKKALYGVELEKKGIEVEGEGKTGNLHSPESLYVRAQGEFSMWDNMSNSNESGTSRSDASSSAPAEGVNMGWGRWYNLKEVEIATNRFAEGNVVGEGGYGVVYRGVFPDGSVVAVKNLLNNKGQAEKEFKVEVEAIGKVRHKNLVGLIGYCAEGDQRMLVYEYVDNGNLEQWLHGDVGPVSPLTWDIRMKIAIGTAKGLAYLHEGLEPKVVHRDVKSSNILLDRKWNAKVSDFGLAKLLGSDKSFVNTRVMGTFGYVSPDYASTGMLNEGSDVYSFGVLLMEMVTGRSPVDYSKAPGEMNLVDWFKGMVASRRGEELVDPLIQVQPPQRALKRVLLVCLRCIDMDANKRPKMGKIVHMLEAEDFPFRSEPRTSRETAPLRLDATVASDAPLKDEVGGDDRRSNWR